MVRAESGKPRAEACHLTAPGTVTLAGEFLPEHFGRSVILSTYTFDAGVVNREHPDVVIQEFAERALSGIIPWSSPIVAEPGPASRPAR